MKIYTIKRGVHPHEGRGGKRETGSIPVRVAAAPAVVAIALAQHTGAPCVPVVRKGDRVLLGQKVGEPQGYVGAPVHASVSGVVRGIELRTAIGGHHVDCVVIESDGRDEWDESLPKFADPLSADPQALLRSVRDAGIVGLGGAAFPTHVKLTPPNGKRIEYVILNGAECEPYLSSDHRMMLDHPDKVVDGLLIATRIVGANRMKIGIERNKPDAIEAIAKAAAGREIDVCALKVKYPQGGEKQLIQALTGREVPSGKLPMETCCVVLNVSTAAAISDAVRLGRPVTERIVTVAGEVKNPCNVLARVGVPIGSLVEECGGMNEGADKVIVGGPMMGMSIFDLNSPTVKAMGGVLLLRDETGEVDPPRNCIRCGSCVRACPAGLRPLNLYALSHKGMHEQSYETMNVMDCIECGACAFVCPAKLPIVQMIRVTKRALPKK